MVDGLLDWFVWLSGKRVECGWVAWLVCETVREKSSGWMGCLVGWFVGWLLKLPSVVVVVVVQAIRTAAAVVSALASGTSPSACVTLASLATTARFSSALAPPPAAHMVRSSLLCS